MSLHSTITLPSNAKLLQATLLALVCASAILLTAVLPAEYGIDPTGLGRRLGLLALTGASKAGATPVDAAADGTAALATRSAEVFGAQAGQSFDARAASASPAAPRTDTLKVTLPPGGGAEVKALLQAGQGFVFHWRASAAVAFDMHGERPGTKDAYTSYAIAGAQQEGAGQFTAPFDGQHGWYWRNGGAEPVTVEVSVTGFQTKLFQPGHP